MEKYLKISANDIRLENLILDEFVNRISGIHDSISALKKTASGMRLQEVSCFMEDLLLGMPMKPIYVDGSQDKWQIIEGRERIVMLAAFVYGELVLSGSQGEFCRHLESARFNELPTMFRDKLRYMKIPVYILNPGAPNVTRYAFYRYVLLPMTNTKRGQILSALFPKNYYALKEYSSAVAGRLQTRNVTMVEDLVIYAMLTKWLCKVKDSCGHQAGVESLVVEIMEGDDMANLLQAVEDKAMEFAIKMQSEEKRRMMMVVLTLQSRLMEKEELVSLFEQAWKDTRNYKMVTRSDGDSLYKRAIEMIKIIEQ